MGPEPGSPSSRSTQRWSRPAPATKEHPHEGRTPLRIASVLTFIHAVLHTIGGVFGKTPPGPAAMVLATMKANPFPVLGVTRTFWDFYHGMSLGVTISLTAEAIIMWQLSSLAKHSTPHLRPILVTFLIAYLALAVNSYAYFFAGPVIAEILIAACLLWAIVAAKPVAGSA